MATGAVILVFGVWHDVRSLYLARGKIDEFSIGAKTKISNFELDNLQIGGRQYCQWTPLL